MAEIVTDTEYCVIFTHDNMNLVHHPSEVVGVGAKIGYPDNLEIVCCASLESAEEEIVRLKLNDDRD